MDGIHPWLGDINELTSLSRPAVGLICTAASTLCGAAIGLERERRDKPAGVRTVVLIAVGSTIFTLVSLLLGERKAIADPARLAAQILPGIGFLGAGAIIQSRGTVVGLTTAATIWAVAAVGVTIGAGYIAAGVVFSLVILLTLTSFQRLEWLANGRCRLHATTVRYRASSGKTRPKLQEVLDRHRVPEGLIGHRSEEPGRGLLEVRLCVRHREHRVILKELAEIDEVEALEVQGQS